MWTPDFSDARWRKSSRSSGGADNCVEVAADARGRWVAIHDSKQPDGAALVVTPTEFAALLHALKTDQLI